VERHAPHVELLGFRRDSNHPPALPEGLAARHHTLQQVSFQYIFNEDCYVKLPPDEVIPTAFQSHIVGMGGGEAPPLQFSGEGRGSSDPATQLGLLHLGTSKRSTNLLYSSIIYVLQSQSDWSCAYRDNKIFENLHSSFFEID